MGPRRMVRRRAGPRRKLVWATSNGDFALPVGGAAAFDNHNLLGNLQVAGASVLGATVMRTRGVLWPDWTGAAVGDKFKFGLLVATTDQIGVAAPADDLTNEDGRDWAFLMECHPTTQGGGVGQEPIVFDVKAKRKIQELNQVWLMPMRHITGANALTVHSFIRTLIALP